jgi:hypothetical protein
MLELALIVIAVLVAAIAGGVWAVRMERKYPTSYTRRVGSSAADNAALDAVELREQGFVRGEAGWRRLGAEDEAFLDPAAQAVLDAEDDAREAAEHLAQRAAQINVEFHP